MCQTKPLFTLVLNDRHTATAAVHWCTVQVKMLEDMMLWVVFRHQKIFKNIVKDELFNCHIYNTAEHSSVECITVSV